MPFIMKAAAILALALLSFAQEKPAEKLCTISGTVIKEPGSQPLKKAIITLIAEDQESGKNYTTISDNEGHFALNDVRPGRYRMLLERTGYTEINSRKHKSEGRTLSLSAGQQIENFPLKMLATSAVLGKVVDADGDPVPSVEVVVLRKRYGNSQWESEKSERTNDLGEYRISGLFPGQHYLFATPPPDYDSLTHPNPDSKEQDSTRDLRPLTTYYPGTVDRNQASAVDLRAGDELPINFTMIPSRAFSVRGRVIGVPPNQKAEVVFNAREYDLIVNAAEVDKNGNFEIHGVAPGSYTVIAFVNDHDGAFRVARKRVDVLHSDIEDLRLAPSPSGMVTGRVLVDRAPGPFPDISISIRSLDEEDGDQNGFVGPSGFFSGRTANLTSDGSFKLKGVPAGEYVVQITTNSSKWSRYFVQSVQGFGAATDKTIAVHGDLGPVYVTLSSNAAVIEGAVVGDNDKPSPDCTVVAVPEQESRRFTAQFGKTHCDQNGHFTIQNLAPGAYTFYAWQDLEGEPYLDPDFLKKQQDHGIKLSTKSGTSNQRILLHAFPVPEDAN